MKTILLTLLATTGLVVDASEYAPVGKVVSMLTELHAKITKEGEVARIQHEEFVHWCADRTANLGFAITTGNSQVASLRAAIASETAKISALAARIEELIAAIATNEADLKAAAQVRSKEAADFSAGGKELLENIDILKRAIGILEREMNTGGASMMQLKDAGSLAKALDTMVQASLLDTGDAKRLTAFVQQAQTGEGRESEEDEAPGAPAGAVYVSQSGNIVDTMQDLLDRAQSALADLRQKEVTAQHNYNMLRQSLEDEIRFAQADLAAARKAMAEAQERKTAAEGELKAVLAQLAEDTKSKAAVVQECMTRAASYKAEVTCRTEELTALIEARRVLQESPGAGCSALDQVSLLQVSRSSLESAQDLHKYEAVRLVRDLARKDGSHALMQLASQMTALMQTSGTFDKVKGLISDLIARLEKEAGADATKKAFCDKELKENAAKKADKTDEIEVQTTRIERMTVRSSQLKEEVATLESQLSKLAEAQARLDKLRVEEQTSFQADKTELEAAISAVRGALQILNDFYSCDHSHVVAVGAAKGIISLLEVVEADFSKGLAEITASEESAVAMHSRLTKENEIERTTCVADVKYKSQESQTLDKTVIELTSDRTTVQSELDAILEYLSKLHDDCAATAESYAERKSRYESEIAGLREALQILETETALLQKHANRKTLRGFGHIRA